MPRDIEAVIFDMDGVLVDSEWLYIEKYAEFLTQQGYPATPQQLTFHAGAGPHRNYAEIQKRFGTPWDRDTYLDLLHEYMAGMQLDYVKAMNAGVRELLRYLKDHGYPTAVASASGLETIGRILLACGIYEYFTVAISTGSVANTKPAPDVYLSAAARLGFAPAQCLAIEDSPRGLAAAVAAGCVAVGKDDARFGFDLSAARYRVPSLLEVIPLVQARGVHG